MRITTLQQIEGLRSLLGDQLVRELKEEFSCWIEIILFESIDEFENDAEIREVIPWHRDEIKRCRREFKKGKTWVLARFINDEFLEH